MRLTDDNVMEELRAQNPEALTFLMHHYREAISRLVRRILQGTATKEDIEECASDVFVHAWNRAATYDPVRGSVGTWLFILAKYEALEVRRRMQRNATTTDTLALDQRSSTDPWVVAGGEDQPVLKQVVSKEQVHALMQWLDEMDGTDRTIFIRRYFYYESIVDIARLLGLTRRAVDNRLSKGRKWLRERRSASDGEEG